MGSGLQPRHPQLFKYCWVQELDSPDANLKKHFDRMSQFLDSVIAANGKVLVHCYAGVSRSATTVIQYLMRAYGLSFVNAYKHVQQQRWFINPNPGFKR